MQSTLLPVQLISLQVLAHQLHVFVDCIGRVGMNHVRDTQEPEGWDVLRKLMESLLRVLRAEARGNLDKYLPALPTRDGEGEASDGVFDIAEEEEIEEEPANHGHQLLVVVVFPLVHTLLEV